MNKQLEHYNHQIKHPVRWGDMDKLGHVNNSNYFRYCEEARVRFLTDSKIRAVVEEANIGFVVAYIDCKFKFPVTYPDDMIIATKVDKVNKDRFTLSQIIYSEAHQIIAGVSESIIVSFNHDMKCKVNLPSEALNLLEKELLCKEQ